MNPEDLRAYIWSHAVAHNWSIVTSVLQAAECGGWPLRCELRKEPSKRLADYLE